MLHYDVGAAASGAHALPTGIGAATRGMTPMAPEPDLNLKGVRASNVRGACKRSGVWHRRKTWVGRFQTPEHKWCEILKQSFVTATLMVR